MQTHRKTETNPEYESTQAGLEIQEIQQPAGKLWSFFRPLLLTGFIGFVLVNLSVEALRMLGRMVSCGGTKVYSSEARQYIGTMNRAQQAYFWENQNFARSFSELNLDLKAETKNYRYSISRTKTATFNYAIPSEDVTEKAYFGLFQWDKKVSDRLYPIVGGVFLVPDAQTHELTPVAISCLAYEPGNKTLSPPTLKDNQLYCPANTRKIN